MQTCRCQILRSTALVLDSAIKKLWKLHYYGKLQGNGKETLLARESTVDSDLLGDSSAHSGVQFPPFIETDVESRLKLS